MPMERLDPQLLLGAYAVGVFPMADGRDADGVYWVEPRRRAILPLDGFHLSRSLRKTLVGERFRVTADQAFDAVLALCAEAAGDRPDTWINPTIADAFGQLHRLGFAHSIECWDGERLAGGLYGLALGRAFFGESMVSRATDSSKVALAWLVARLRAATSAMSAPARASSFFALAWPTSLESALRRSRAACSSPTTPLRRSSRATRRAAMGSRPRLRSPASKASGSSRMRRMSCMGSRRR